jgi:hypothetical protein
MEEVAAVRRAALDAVADIDPAKLRERLEDRLGAASMVPGALTLRSVRAVADRSLAEPDPTEALLDPVAERAAGVQLIYEGLALTRQLAHEDPWSGGSGDEGDLAILAADVLVARGFYLLARTEAADAAVDTVRAFGRDQTVRRATDDPTLDRNLEADVLELAVIAGTTAAGGQVTPRLREFAVGLADEPGFGPAEEFFSEPVADSLCALAAEAPTQEGVLSLDD